MNMHDHVTHEAELFFFLHIAKSGVCGRARPQMSEGRVVATGPGRRSLQDGAQIPVSVKEGDKVLLPEYGGTVVKLDGKE
jgi:co-chaperonin GroES (HSP10)